MPALYFVCDFSGTASDRTSKGINGQISYRTGTNPDGAYTVYNYDTIAFGTNQNVYVRYIITGNASYNLATISANVKYYRCATGTHKLTENTTNYAASKNILDTYWTEIDAATMLSENKTKIYYDNVGSSGSYQTTFSKESIAGGSYDYAVLIPDPYYSEIVLTRPYSQTLTHCTSSISSNEITQNQTTVTLTANTDYKFDTANSPISVSGATFSVVYSSNDTVATVTIDAGSSAVTLTASTITTKRTLTQNLTHCTSDTSSALINQTQTTVVLTSDTDYIFNNNSISVTGATSSVTLSSDNTVATVVIDAGTSGVTINASAVYDGREFTQLLTNCTSDTQDGYIDWSSTTVVLTADTWYVFDNNSITVTGATFSVSYSSNNTVATITIDAGVNPVQISASPTYNARQLTQNLVSCTSNYSDGPVTKNSITINLTTSSTDDKFDSAISPITVTGATYVVNYTDARHATVVIDAGSSDITVNATAVQYCYLDFTNMSHASCSIQPTDKIFANTSYNVVIEADSGYYFESAPRIRYYRVLSSGNIWPQWLTLTSSQTDQYKTIYSGTYSTEVAKASLTYPVDATGSVVPTDDKYGFIKVYNPTVNQMKALAGERFVTGTQGETIDLGQYILNLIMLYVYIEPYLSEYINLGNHVTTVSANVVDETVVETDCGTVQITPYFNNEMDYKHTYIRLYLPLIGMVDIATVLVMGKTLHLIYKTNVINGDSLAILLDNSDDSIIQTFNCKASYKIPYLLNQSNDIHGDLDIDSNYLYGFTPFIEIQRDNSYNTSNIRATDNKFVLLSTLTGFHTVDIINCSIANNAIENEMVINQLREGVNF